MTVYCQAQEIQWMLGGICKWHHAILNQNYPPPPSIMLNGCFTYTFIQSVTKSLTPIPPTCMTSFMNGPLTRLSFFPDWVTRSTRTAVTRIELEPRPGEVFESKNLFRKPSGYLTRQTCLFLVLRIALKGPLHQCWAQTRCTKKHFYLTVRNIRSMLRMHS